ncbi:MAG TPA: hypothetical protein PKL30_24815 [Leptospiraceae bacterium]|nr:hypothetical protein [Leptospiraceae bacterium]HMW06901.1 hypothetical protein [Leptospiraceae bacterium]HMY33431.1 hypothetical protein [Leptospiraceae bacterium]HNC55761.1 hypothetical protein [Leptospiraceae bacterium]HNE08657.1 hypothetical protein [Leptospiraceae bacterium]
MQNQNENVERVTSNSNLKRKSIFLKTKKWFFQNGIEPMLKGGLFGIGIVISIATVGLLAVAVTGTFNTFSSGNVMKASDINANFASLKTAIEGIPTQQSLRLIYETDVTSSTNTVTVSGLNGDTDLSYRIHTVIVSNTASGCDTFVRPNNDSNTANYSSLGINASTSTVGQAYYSTIGGLRVGSTGTSNDMVSCHSFLYAKTGLKRHLVADCIDMANASSTVQNKAHYGGLWTNSATNISSLVFFSTCANGIGAGSHIEVWARR